MKIKTNKGIVKDIVIFVLLILFILSALLSIFIPVIFSSRRYLNITSDNEIINNTLLIEEKSLKSGVIKSTLMRFNCLKPGNYKISFSFQDQHFNDLTQYIDVIIKNEDNILFEDKLDCFFTREIYISDYFQKDSKKNIEIIFILPKEVGNEVQEKSVNLNVLISIKKEWLYENNKT